MFAHPGDNFIAESQNAPPNLEGIIGVTVISTLSEVVVIERTTEGVSEITSGTYAVELEAPGEGFYTIVWDTGGETPQLAIEELIVQAYSQLTLSLQDEVLNWVVGNPTTFIPGLTRISLLTTLPEDDSGIEGAVEVEGNAYQRIPVIWGEAENGYISNSADIVFPTATGTWGTILGSQIWDINQDKVLFYGPYSQPTLIEEGSTFRIRAGDLTVRIA